MKVMWAGAKPSQHLQLSRPRSQKGRDENSQPFTMSWVGHLDRYPDRCLADAEYLSSTGKPSSLIVCESWTIRPKGFCAPLLPHAGANVNAVRRGSKLKYPCYKKPTRRHDYAPRPAHIKWL